MGGDERGVALLKCTHIAGRLLDTHKTLTHAHTTDRLQELDATNNSISAVAPQLGLLASSRGGALRVLLLQGNCVRSIRRGLLEGGTGGLLDYLVTRLPDA